MGPATVVAARTKPMNRCLRILRLLEVAESPEGSSWPGMRAAVFGAFVSQVGAGIGVATLGAKWPVRGADGWTLGCSLADLLGGALAEEWGSVSMCGWPAWRPQLPGRRRPRSGQRGGN